ncbi:MAG: hypothetical protein D4R44_06885 [Actinobacteria bacterium]|nr:MAG: hypothetical protein D4R44_06885 [Actinomycetota bacterium]
MNSPITTRPEEPMQFELQSMVPAVSEGGMYSHPITLYPGTLVYLVTDPAMGIVLDKQKKYDELILAVGKKYPNESRHETALRYIRQAETEHIGGPCDAQKEEQPCNTDSR